MISVISFAIGTLGIIFISVLIEEVVRAIAGEEADQQITQSDLEGFRHGLLWRWYKLPLT